MQDEVKPTVGRRRLLGRASAVVAGVGAAGVATAVAAPAAHAADGSAILQGKTNDGGGANAATTIVNNNAAPALVVDNATGPALQITPRTSPSGPGSAPTGSVHIDRWGDLYTVGDQHPTSGGGVVTGAPYITPVYSATWATMTIPIDPERRLHTGAPGAGGRQFVVPGSATYDSAGRVIPKNSNTVPDLVLDFSDLVSGDAAIQGNLTIYNATVGGWAALYGGSEWPGNSSINYVAKTAIANFTQTQLFNGTFSVKLTMPAVVIFDIAGFIVADKFAQLPFFGASASGPKKAAINQGTGRQAPQPRH